MHFLELTQAPLARGIALPPGDDDQIVNVVAMIAQARRLAPAASIRLAGGGRGGVLCGADVQARRRHQIDFAPPGRSP